MPRNTFYINYEQSNGYFDDYFLNIGYDEFLRTFSPYGIAGLKLIQDLKTGIKYIRIHNMFTDEAGDLRGEIDAGGSVVTRNEAGILMYDFSRLDRVYDTIIQHGYLPYIEFGFMPRALAAKTKNKKNKWKSPPKDYSEWRKLIQKTVSHLKSRYPEKISKFFWELWNEPNFPPIYFKGSVREYCKLYDYTVAGMMDVFPDSNFTIGGPALVQNMFPFLFGFIQHCTKGKNHVTSKIGTKLDFISFHLKGGMLFTQTPNVQKIQRMLVIHHKFIKWLRPEGIELHITELDPVVGCDKGIYDSKKLNWRNTHYYAAFVGFVAQKIYFLKKKHKMNLSIAFSDNFHIADDAKQFFGGARHLTTAPFLSSSWKQNVKFNYAIAKPIVKAYQILNRMRGRVLSQIYNPRLNPHSMSMLVTEQHSEEKVSIMVSNFNRSFRTSKKRKIRIIIQNLPNNWTQVNIRKYVVDEQSNNIYRIWKDCGSPSTLSGRIFKTIKNSEKLMISSEDFSDVINNKLVLNEKCRPHSLSYYEIFREE